MIIRYFDWISKIETFEHVAVSDINYDTSYTRKQLNQRQTVIKISDKNQEIKSDIILINYKNTISLNVKKSVFFLKNLKFLGNKSASPN